MKNFNIRRFGQTLKYEFVTNFRSFLWFALGMTLVYVVLFWFVHQWRMSGPMPVAVINHSVAHGARIVMCIFLLCSACVWFRDTQKKAPRIVMLMLPASNLEKFLSRWVYLVVFTIVCGMFTFFVADLLHAVYLGISGESMAFTSGIFLRDFPHGGNPYATSLVYSSFICIHAFGLMCGVLFKKYHVFASMATWILLFAVVGYSLYLLFPDDQIHILSQEQIDQRTRVAIVGTCIGTVLWTFLAYRIFCHWQVVTHKFVNL